MATPFDNVIPFPVRGDALPTRTQPSLPPPPATTNRYVARVDLDDAEPLVWRQLELASDLTLQELHEVLQTAMGWTDSHLHNFTVGPKHDYSIAPFLTDYDEEEGDEGTHERDVRLDQVLLEVGDQLHYTYDFGDGWEHTIRLESIEAYVDTAPRARVLDGLRACPPEDCGGVGGYESLLEAVAAGSAADEDQRHLLDWLGDGFAPERFSAAETDKLLELTMSSLGGSGAIAARLDLVGSGLSETLRELVERSHRAPKPLSWLLAAAELTLLDEPDATSKAGMVRPWLHFLEVVGSGLKLTGAGWLPPAVVTRIATDLDLLEPWMGKGNREEFTLPVLRLRETATALGLVRKLKGELLLTARGQRLADDPEALWQHIADALPLGGKDFVRHAGAIMLLAVAAGEAPYAGIVKHGSDLLWHAGWMDAGGRPPSEGAAIEFARPTWHALKVAGCDPTVSTHEQVTEGMRQLARASLRAH